MKRWYSALASAAILFAAAGALLSLTASHSETMRDALGRCFVAASVVGLVLCAALKPKAAVKEAAVGSEYVRDGETAACTFDDVAANDEALKSLRQLRDYLISPEKYGKYGARMPAGVLLYGPPGTGKTLLARALAGEANVPFYALSGSDFVEKYVGVGAKRVRELFRKARKAGRCVIFIDEIDAMGKSRSDASSDERDQTLNALLSEMSGFANREGVLVVAATNRMEMLDPALLRPGRFDRQIEVGLPGRQERLEILRLHLRNKPVSDEVDLEKLAAETVFFSGAALENLINEAAVAAAEDDDGEISEKHIAGAFMKGIVGAEKESRADAQERKIIALHESGHALVSRILTPESRITRVSILPAGRGAAGYNLVIPQEKVMMRRGDLENQMCVLLAGRAAEILIFGEENVTAGASNDLDRAAQIASAMVCELGMGGEAAVAYKSLARSFGANGAAMEKAKSVLGDQLERAKRILAENAEMLGRLAEALLDKETLDGRELEVVFGEMSNERQKPAQADAIR